MRCLALTFWPPILPSLLLTGLVVACAGEVSEATAFPSPPETSVRATGIEWRLQAGEGRTVELRAEAGEGDSALTHWVLEGVRAEMSDSDFLLEARKATWEPSAQRLLLEGDVKGRVQKAGFEATHLSLDLADGEWVATEGILLSVGGGAFSATRAGGGLSASSRMWMEAPRARFQNIGKKRD